MKKLYLLIVSVVSIILFIIWLYYFLYSDKWNNEIIRTGFRFEIKDDWLYCLHGDKSNKTPEVGYYYTETKINISWLKSDLVLINYFTASDWINIYTINFNWVFCSHGMPASCSCWFTIETIN